MGSKKGMGFMLPKASACEGKSNNYAEAGMRILKDLVFSRVKAYNLVQMFSFVTECLELYYSRKISSVAHNRFEHHISLKFQGIKCSSISKSQIEQQ